MVLAGLFATQFANAGENNRGGQGRAALCRQVSAEEASRIPFCNQRQRPTAAPTEEAPPAEEVIPSEAPAEGQDGGGAQGQEGGGAQGQEGGGNGADLAAAAKQAEDTFKASCRAFARAQFAAQQAGALGQGDQGDQSGNPVAELEANMINSCITLAQAAAAAGGVDINQ